jgi:hypothetical protein
MMRGGTLRRRSSGAAGALVAFTLAASAAAQPPSDVASPPSAVPPSAVPPSAVPSSFDPTALAERLARALVRVEVEDARGLGVFVGDAGRVLTAYALIDRATAPSLVLANGSRVGARVVDWNAGAGLALLQPESPVPAEALALAPREPALGEAVVTPDLVRAPDAKDDALVTLIGGGTVSGASGGSLWMDAPLATDDLGRPIVSRDGALYGVVVANADADAKAASAPPPAGTRARAAGRSALEPLVSSRALRGDFAPTSHARWENLRGLITVPLARDGLIGAGFQFGYRREWFVALIREGFVANGFAPQSATSYERVQRRAFFELEAQAQLRLGRTRLFAGAGGAILADNRESRSVDAAGITSKDNEHITRLRPLASIGLNTDPLEVGVVTYIGEDVETRLNIGLIWGR